MCEGCGIHTSCPEVLLLFIGKTISSNKHLHEHMLSFKELLKEGSQRLKVLCMCMASVEVQQQTTAISKTSFIGRSSSMLAWPVFNSNLI